MQPPSDDELADWKKKDAHYADMLRKLSGSRALEGESGFLALERTGSRPTLDANGIIGGFTGKGEKTVIPARASAKVSMRLVPNQDPKKILASLEKYVRTLTTPGVEIMLDVLMGAPPVSSDVDHPAADALRAAFREAFGKETALVRVGGSIPVALDFQQTVGAPLLISGIPQADNAVHSPNEHLAIGQYHLGVEAMIRFICKLGEQRA